MSIPYFDIILLTIIGLLELGFALYIFTKYQRSQAITFFGLAVLFISGWVLTNGDGMLLTPGSAAFELVGKATFAFAAFIFPFFYLFIIAFPYQSAQIGRRLVFFVLLTPAVIIGLLFFTDSLIKDFGNTHVGTPLYGPYFILYVIYCLLIYGLIFVEIFLKMPRLEGMRRWQMKLLMIAFFFSGVIGLMVNLILPYFSEIQLNYWLGPASSFILLGLIWYIVIRKN